MTDKTTEAIAAGRRMGTRIALAAQREAAIRELEVLRDAIAGARDVGDATRIVTDRLNALDAGDGNA